LPVLPDNTLFLFQSIERAPTNLSQRPAYFAFNFCFPLPTSLKLFVCQVFIYSLLTSALLHLCFPFIRTLADSYEILLQCRQSWSKPLSLFLTRYSELLIHRDLRSVDMFCFSFRLYRFSVLGIPWSLFLSYQVCRFESTRQNCSPGNLLPVISS
jgi:hypothetical protein